MRALVLVILSIALMVMDRRMTGFASIRSVLTLPAAPLQYLVHAPTKLIDIISERVRSHQSLAVENAQLKEEQLLLHSRLQRLAAIESENNYLKTLFSHNNCLIVFQSISRLNTRISI